jgi:hypothetical protein
LLPQVDATQGSPLDDDELLELDELVLDEDDLATDDVVLE